VSGIEDRIVRRREQIRRAEVKFGPLPPSRYQSWKYQVVPGVVATVPVACGIAFRSTVRVSAPPGSIRSAPPLSPKGPRQNNSPEF